VASIRINLFGAGERGEGAPSPLRRGEGRGGGKGALGYYLREDFFLSTLKKREEKEGERQSNKSTDSSTGGKKGERAAIGRGKVLSERGRVTYFLPRGEGTSSPSLEGPFLFFLRRGEKYRKNRCQTRKPIFQQGGGEKGRGGGTLQRLGLSICGRGFSSRRGKESHQS